jgi:hypothetical protein
MNRKPNLIYDYTVYSSVIMGLVTPLPFHPMIVSFRKGTKDYKNTKRRNKRMANENQTVESLDKQISDLERNSRYLREKKKHKCEHKPKNGGALMPIRESKFKFEGKDSLPNTTVICTACRTYFESESYTQEEVDAALFVLRSIIEQTKVFNNNSQEDLEKIQRIYDAYDEMEDLANGYYRDMVNKLTSNGGRKPARHSSKGGFGVNRNQFNSGRSDRRYYE